ncbi:hypothetical protein GWI33_014738 [Rhynchophorus ferrugineus]|uniref:Uncharacterized protein n=1 Tax=Rhynchophorus ferrugineus TaxID=354439 RepID=A0A834I3W9_RHYFE|nr:hypothetical protein GWI33_014738 [Rhynchophorus ferrugineus]
MEEKSETPVSAPQRVPLPALRPASSASFCCRGPHVRRRRSRCCSRATGTQTVLSCRGVRTSPASSTSPSRPSPPPHVATPPLFCPFFGTFLESYSRPYLTRVHTLKATLFAAIDKIDCLVLSS